LYDLKIRSLFVRFLSACLKYVGSVSPKPNILLPSLYPSHLGLSFLLTVTKLTQSDAVDSIGSHAYSIPYAYFSSEARSQNRISLSNGAWDHHKCCCTNHRSVLKGSKDDL